MSHRDCLPSSVAFDVYAEGATEMLSSRAKLLEILDSLGDALPPKLKHIRREEANLEQPKAKPCDLDSNVKDESWKDIEVEAGPSLVSEHKPQSTDTTEFETEWAKLPLAITSMPSFGNVRQLVMRNSTGKTSFQLSLPVLYNGIDHCFLSRPAFHQVLLDLDADCQDVFPEPAEDVGLLPSHPDPLALTEALWESHFGVPRHFKWYSALAELDDGVMGCSSLHFSPPNPTRFGLSRISADSPIDVVHCAVACTKRPLCFVGPTCGILYAVVQGTLLLISWPSTKHNFDAWHKMSRSVDTNQYDHLDELQDPHINVLRTGDAVYLAVGTTNVMVALSHVALTSRQILNPTAKELSTIVRCSNRLMDSYIEQQSKGYSPFDEMEVERMGVNVALWMALANGLSTVQVKMKQGSINKKLPKVATTKGRLSARTLQDFRQGLQGVERKIQRYRASVNEAAANAGRGKRGSGDCPRNRPYDTLNALARCASSVELGADATSLLLDEAADSLHHYLRSGLSIASHSLKGKDRAPS
ncbi:hypothetical protein EX895_005015 [Sporisorium graminicola]|uniref:Uncharacterized protein n=1 Tax=Sporisorium graminicola TaxID=280036 RepID=A0A4U7KPB2_9BASI|nr:hypothetical protein EX895_005015 [Sporisorium graminicola]TKY86190.1 hypothetical protein EX895_005015 [Sporisorium graminicola]